MFNEPSADQENTYIFDPESAAEMARLINQGRMLTKWMGGPLAEHAHPEEQFRTILDVACGPGDWVLDLALDCPESTITGIDISKTMIDYANARARSQQLPNISFGVMDIRQPLDFSDESFDLINARLLVTVLKREDWPGLLAECKRLLKPGGILRLTECDHFSLTTSPANEQMIALLQQALHQAGYGFSPDGRTTGITPALPWLLRKAEFVEIESQAHALRFSPYDETYAVCRANVHIVIHQSRPLLVKTGLISEDALNKLHQQIEIEMLSDDFSGVWPFLTVWGHKPQ